MRLLGAGGLRGGRTRLLRRLRSAAGAARRLLARLGRLCRLRGGRRIRRLVRLRGWLGRFRLVRLFGRLRRLRGLREGHVVRCAAAAAALLSVRPQDLRLLRQRIGRAHPSARKHDSHRTGQKRKDQHGRADPAPDCFPSHGTTPRKKRTLQQSLQRPHLRTTICPVSRTMRAEPPQAGLLTHASTAARAFSGFPNDRLSPCTRPPRIQRRYRPGFSPGSLSSPAARTAAEALEASIALSITRADFFVKPVPVCVSAFAKKIRISVLDRRARMVYNQSSPHKACAA